MSMSLEKLNQIKIDARASALKRLAFVRTVLPVIYCAMMDFDKDDYLDIYSSGNFFTINVKNITQFRKVRSFVKKVLPEWHQEGAPRVGLYYADNLYAEYLHSDKDSPLWGVRIQIQNNLGYFKKMGLVKEDCHIRTRPGNQTSLVCDLR